MFILSLPEPKKVVFGVMSVCLCTKLETKPVVRFWWNPVCRYKSTISPGVFFIFLFFLFLRAVYPQKPLKNSKNQNCTKTSLTILIKLIWFVGLSVPYKMIPPGSLRIGSFKSYNIFNVSKLSFLGVLQLNY